MAVIHNLRAILLAVFIAFGGFLFGYDAGVISGCLIMPDFQRRFGTCDAGGQNCVLDASRQSFIVSLLCAGTFVGSLVQAFTADKFGRRSSIFIWTSIFIVGVAIQTGTMQSLAQICIGRVIAGLGVGAMSALVPLYNGELAPKAIRGSVLAMYQLQIMVGIFVAYCIELVTQNINNSASWRIPIGIQILWGLIICSGILSLPESPRYLIGIGKHDEARQVVAKMNNTGLDDPIVMEELEIGIKAENEGGKISWMECFSTRNMLWKRTMNGMMLQCIQQLNGIGFYYLYGDTFFQAAGTTISPFLIQTILGAVSVVGTFPSLHLIESWGRRKSLLIGALLQAVCALVVGLAGHFMLAPAGTATALFTRRNKQGGAMVIAFAILHVFVFNFTWGPVPWVYLGESFPLRVRPKCIALGSATNWFWSFLIAFFAPKILNQIGPLLLLIFFCMLLVGWVYVFFFIPETKGLSLEEVDELYRAKIKPWRSVGWRPHLYDGRNQQQNTDMSDSDTKERTESNEA